MRTLVTILCMLLLGTSAQSQSFYHKRMKKVKSTSVCTSEGSKAIQPRVTFYQSLNQASMYKDKRRQYRRKRG